MLAANKRIKDLECEISQEKSRLKRIKTIYKNKCGNLIIRTLKADANYILEKDRFEQRINNQKKLIENLQYKLTECKEFDFDLGMEFLAAVISIFEQEEYTYQKATLQGREMVMPGFHTTSLSYTMIYDKIGIITRTAIRDTIRPEQYNCPNRLEYKLHQKNEKNIILGQLPELTIIDDQNKVPINITNDFPYLTVVCMELAGEKLKYPDKSEEAICSEYLSDLKEKSKKRKNIYRK